MQYPRCFVACIFKGCTIICCLLIFCFGNLLAQSPVISSFTPKQGPIGTIITLNGTNLKSSTTLKIGGVNAIILSNSDNKLTGLVMPGTVNGKITVSASDGIINIDTNFTVSATTYPSIEQGGNLIGTGGAGTTGYTQGQAVAISADGNTAVVGGGQDGNGEGAVWIYTRNNNVWSQQGSKLTGTNNIGAGFGCSVGISADGNTIIAGGYLDNRAQGAAWIFIRNGNTWVQQGEKLIGTGNVGNAGQGYAVALSADGNTALSAGFTDNGYLGAVWTFSRTNGIWTQRGNKVPGIDGRGLSAEPQSLAISADGQTFIIGNSSDSSGKGSSIVYINQNNFWVLQQKLVGNDVSGFANQGQAVALSADGNIALIGGSADNNYLGAAWVFKRVNGNWVQQGKKLLGNGATSEALQGTAVALSADGAIAMVTGPFDNGGLSNSGSCWVYKQNNNVWTEVGKKLSINENTSPEFGSSIGLSANGTTAIIGSSYYNDFEGLANIFVAVLPPVITGVNQTTAASGANIVITGTSFSGTTAVSFGGVPAKSFIINSPTSITAVVGEGSSGDFSVTTPAGIAIFSGFHYVPKPSIVVTGQTSFLQGDSVLLTVNPAAGFNFQWKKDGINIPGATGTNYTAYQSGNYAVSLSLNDITTVSDTIAVKAVFTLPVQNFKITITSSTCKGANNGIINITAMQDLNYTATVSSGGIIKSYPFTDFLSIDNLSPETYSICITVANQTTYKQCYDAIVTEPEDLSVFIVANNSTRNINLSLSGGDQYNIALNGVLYFTKDSTFSIPAVTGNNHLVVYTDKLCQGVIDKIINISEKITPYPVPFHNILNFNLGNVSVDKAVIRIYNVSNDQEVYFNQYFNQSGVLQFDLSNLNYGIFAFHIIMDGSEKVFKIIKK